MKYYKTLVITFIVSILTSLNLKAQDELPLRFHMGASFTLAPSFNANGVWIFSTEGSARFYSFFSDLTISKTFIGRLQYSKLSVGSLPEKSADKIDSGFQIHGSLGYNLHFASNQKINIPLMVTIGYSSVANSSASDVGMQFGGTVGFNYQLSERINASSSLRYLKGLEVNDGSIFSQWDISVGIALRIL